MSVVYAPRRLRRQLSNIVLGSTACIGYLKWENDRAARNARPAYVDECGDPIYGGCDDRPLNEYQKLRIYGSLMLDRLPLQPWHICAFVSGAFAYRSFGNFNRLMSSRCADVYYQIRRPDLLHTKVVAVRYALVGAVLMPLVFTSVAAWMIYSWRQGVNPMTAALRSTPLTSGGGTSSSHGHDEEDSTHVSADHLTKQEEVMQAMQEYNHSRHVLREAALRLQDTFGGTLEILSETNMSQFSRFIGGRGGVFPQGYNPY